MWRSLLNSCLGYSVITRQADYDWDLVTCISSDEISIIDSSLDSSNNLQQKQWQILILCLNFLFLPQMTSLPLCRKFIPYFPNSVKFFRFCLSPRIRTVAELFNVSWSTALLSKQHRFSRSSTSIRTRLSKISMATM